MTRPLAGRRVVVTRPVGQAQELVEGVAALGAQVVELPVTAILPIAGSAEIDAALGRLADYQVIVVTSANGATCFAERLVSSGVAPAARTTIVAVGDATAAALGRHGITVHLRPRVATGAAIVAELAARDLVGTWILLPRARAGRPELPAGLREAGAIVDDVAFYETVRSPVTAEAVEAARRSHDVVLTAPSNVEAYIEVLGPDAAVLRVVTIGPTTSAAVRRAGLTVAAESTEQSVAGLLGAIRSLPNPE